MQITSRDVDASGGKKPEEDDSQTTISNHSNHAHLCMRIARSRMLADLVHEACNAERERGRWSACELVGAADGGWLAWARARGRRLTKVGENIVEPAVDELHSGPVQVSSDQLVV